MRIKKIVQDYRMSVQMVERAKINANAVVLCLPSGEYLVFMDKNLPDNIKLFSLAHEAAHIELGLFYTKTSQYDAKIESQVDRRAIDLLEDVMLPEKHGELVGKFTVSTKELFNCLAGTDIFTKDALLWGTSLCK